jgi:hypothetical protein
MTTWTLPANCDPKKGQDAIIALIRSLPQANPFSLSSETLKKRTDCQ